ncbi:MAG: hypothetical protein ACYTBS_27265 [Planctomycetota bacterium]
MTNRKHLRKGMIIFCLFAVAATLGYYLKSSGYKPSGLSSSVGWLMLMVICGGTAISRRRRARVEKDKNADNKAS